MPDIKKTYWNSFPPVGVTPAGNAVEPVFTLNEKSGDLVQTGERNLQEEVNAAAVGVTPYEIFDRYAKTGDLSPLNEKQGTTGDVDVSDMPDNLSDADRAIKEGSSVLCGLEKAPKEPAKAPAEPAPAPSTVEPVKAAVAAPEAQK